MIEIFKLVDCNMLHSKKKNKDYFYVVVYSTVEYVMKIFVDEELYDIINQFDWVDFAKVDLDNCINKSYRNGKFYYSFNDKFYDRVKEVASQQKFIEE